MPDTTTPAGQVADSIVRLQGMEKQLDAMKAILENLKVLGQDTTLLQASFDAIVSARDSLLATMSKLTP